MCTASGGRGFADGAGRSPRSTATAVLDFELAEPAHRAGERLRAFAAEHGAEPVAQSRIERAIRAAVATAVREPHTGAIRVVADIEDDTLEVVISGGAGGFLADPEWSDDLRTIAYCAQAFTMHGTPEVWMSFPLRA